MWGCSWGMVVLEGDGDAWGPLCTFSHGVHLMPPCFDLLQMRGIINEMKRAKNL